MVASLPVPPVEEKMIGENELCSTWWMYWRYCLFFSLLWGLYVVDKEDHWFKVAYELTLKKKALSLLVHQKHQLPLQLQ